MLTGSPIFPNHQNQKSKEAYTARRPMYFNNEKNYELRAQVYATVLNVMESPRHNPVEVIPTNHQDHINVDRTKKEREKRNHKDDEAYDTQ